MKINRRKSTPECWIACGRQCSMKDSSDCIVDSSLGSSVRRTELFKSWLTVGWSIRDAQHVVFRKTRSWFVLVKSRPLSVFLVSNRLRRRFCFFQSARYHAHLPLPSAPYTDAGSQHWLSRSLENHNQNDTEWRNQRTVERLSHCQRAPASSRSRHFLNIWKCEETCWDGKAAELDCCIVFFCFRI